MDYSTYVRTPHDDMIELINYLPFYKDPGEVMVDWLGNCSKFE